MRAIAVESLGNRPRLMELSELAPAPGEVVVSIEAASINPLDWKAAEGAFPGVMDHEFPFVLGFDGAGRVEALGPDADRFAVGDLIHGQFWNETVAHMARR